MKKGQSLSKKLDEYKKLYEQKEKEWDELIANLEKEKEEEVKKVKDSFEAKKKNANIITIDNKSTPSNYLQTLKLDGKTHAAAQQETDEICHHKFSMIRESEERIKLLDKQCKTKIDQIISLDDEYILKQKKKKEKELNKINKEYENLKLYIKRLNRP